MCTVHRFGKDLISIHLVRSCRGKVNFCSDRMHDKHLRYTPAREYASTSTTTSSTVAFPDPISVNEILPFARAGLGAAVSLACAIRLSNDGNNDVSCLCAVSLFACPGKVNDNLHRTLTSPNVSVVSR